MTIRAQTRGWRAVHTGSAVVGLVGATELAARSTAATWLLVVGLLGLAIGMRQSWQRVTIDGSGLTLHRAPGREHVPWSRIARIEVRWLRWEDGGSLGRAAHPLIEQHDGRRLRSSVLADLRRDARRDERARTHQVLARHAAAHDIDLVVLTPGSSDEGPDEGPDVDPASR